jgi:hypothetical protein
MADVEYIHHRPVEFKAFYSPRGMVGSWTKDRGNQVAAHAALIAPKPGQGKGYATGELASNIRVKGPVVGRRGPELDVVSSTNHSVFVHEGTPPHTIKAKPGKKMVFFWRKAGRVVFADKVRHPGTPANPFLVKALRAVFGGPAR